MARIKVNDINPSDTELLLDLSKQELSAINGGGFFGKIIGAVVGAVVGIITPKKGDTFKAAKIGSFIGGLIIPF